ncbi:hypothetical protein BJY04DRAFT_216109 [Aspergillus karnatakaensis]|uniref:putative GPI anchored glycoprotein n=1 Tax=Aspergillus karnatakaensis TaxID=1810916 RepID=UPI003CCE1732
MHAQIIRSVALLGGVCLAAANDIVSLILPNFDDQALVGEIVGTDGDFTTYVINCPDDTDSSDCGVPPEGVTVTAAPSAFIYEYSYEDYWLYQSCSHRGTTYFSCDVTNTQSDFSTEMTAATSIEMPYIAVTITATETGSGSSSQTTSTATSSADEEEATSASDSESPSVTPGPTETPSPTADNEEADAEETNSDNAAVALPTGAAQWLVGGAGIAVALALA